MDVIAELDVSCAPEHLLVWIRELDRYPAWLSIVPRAVKESALTGGLDHPDEPAWGVELRAKVGPLARSKRLRMVRVIDRPDHVRFERRELDDREHSPWVLDARIDPAADGASHLTMRLHYGGNLAVGLLEKLLRDEIEASKPRLRALVEAPAPT